MEARILEHNVLQEFVTAREVDLALAAPNSPFLLCLRGQFDGACDFFTIQLHDVEYLDLLGGLTIGEVLFFSEAERAFDISSKWTWLHGLVSGAAMVIRTADASSWETALANEVFIVVANRIAIHAGADWADEVKRLGL